MNDQDLDFWRDRMVAALCGELYETGRRELERALAADDELRRDWQELGEARALLDPIRGEEYAPSQPFTLPAHAGGSGRGPGGGAMRWLLAAAAGFLLAAALSVGLLLAGLRIDRTPGGLLVAFSHETVLDQRLEIASQRALAQEQLAQYLTRDEFMTLARTLAGATAARLDELERRQSVSQSETARLLYQALASRQQRQYNDLRARLQVASVRSGGETRRASSPALPDSPTD
jgi:hypothetical protein